jgi:hypothetical protein
MPLDGSAKEALDQIVRFGGGKITWVHIHKHRKVRTGM